MKDEIQKEIKRLEDQMKDEPGRGYKRAIDYIRSVSGGNLRLKEGRDVLNSVAIALDIDRDFLVSKLLKASIKREATNIVLAKMHQASQKTPEQFMRVSKKTEPPVEVDETNRYAALQDIEEDEERAERIYSTFGHHGSMGLALPAAQRMFGNDFTPIDEDAPF